MAQFAWHKTAKREVSMYITAYFDKTNSSMHVWVSKNMPVVPEDEEDSVIAVFDTDKPIPSKRTVITKAGVLEAQGKMPHFGDDTVSEEIDLSQSEHFGTKLIQIFYKES